MTHTHIYVYMYIYIYDMPLIVLYSINILDHSVVVDSIVRIHTLTYIIPHLTLIPSDLIAKSPPPSGMQQVNNVKLSYDLLNGFYR